MGKKNKKKTIASTRPSANEEKEEILEEKKKRKLLKLFSGKEKKQVEQKAETKEENAIAAEIARKAEAAAQVKAEAAAAKTGSHPTHAEKQRKEKKKLLSAHKQKIKGGLLVLIGLFALTFIGWFLFGKMLRAEYLAEILPASNTVGVLEMNVDGAAGQPKQFYDLMAKYPVYQKVGLEKLLTLVLPVNFENDIEPWLGRRVGLGLVTGAQPGTLERIYFVESRDHNLTLEFLKNQALKSAKEEITSTEYKGYTVYSYTLSNLFKFTFINNYLVLAENGQTLNALLDRISAGEARLTDDGDYRKVSNNLPQGGLISGYVNFQKLFDDLAANQDFINRKGQAFMAFKPFLALFKNGGVTVFADKGRFAIQTFTGINKDNLNNAGYITYSERYTGNLLSYASDDPVLIFGGHDLTKEISRMSEIFQGGTKTSNLIFDGLLQAQKDIYFGKDISMENDIYPLLQGEYLFTVDNSLEQPQLSLIMEMADKNKDTQLFEKVVSAFQKTSGIFTPHLQDVTLPDGTKGQEIVATPEQVERYDETYSDTNIATLKMGNTGWSVYYAYVGNRVAMSTSKDLLKNIIDRAEGKLEAGFTSSNFYKQTMASLMSTADEVANVKMGAFTEALGLNDNQMLKPYLLPFANLTFAKNYFSDGISTVYLLGVI